MDALYKAILLRNGKEDAPINLIDHAYTDALGVCLADGKDVPSRVGPTRSLIGYQIRLRLTVPSGEYARRGPFALSPALLTSKKVFMKNVMGELLWFTGFGRKKLPSGRIVDTNIETLHELGGGRIWDDDASKAAARGYPFAEGECGRIYGWQWCAFGVEPNADGTCPHPTGGVHQLLAAEKLLRADPFSRQNVVVAFDPEKKGVLPPCHMLFELFGRPADKDTPEGSRGYLDMVMVMRSCDMGLGLPFNMFSYSVLLAIFAKSAGLTPRTLTIQIGDLHIYHNHAEGLAKQMEVDPAPPSAYVLPEAVTSISSLWEPEVTAELLMSGADDYYKTCGPPVKLPLST
jgi:thymidylate synthase